MDELNISIEETSEIYRTVSIGIPKELFDQNFNGAVRHLTKQVDIKGFRKGKVPPSVVKQRYGDSVKNDVLMDLVNGAVSKAVQDNELRFVDVETIDLGDPDEEGNYSATAKLAVFPEPEVRNYEGLKLEVVKQEYSEEGKEEEIKQLLKSYSEVEEVKERDTIEDEDIVEVKLKVVGEEEEPTNETIELGTGAAIPGLEKALIGKKLGDQVEFSHDYPEDYPNETFAGKTYEFTMQPTKISVRNFPERDDEFAKKTKLADTYDELLAFVEKELKSRIENQNSQAKEDAFFKELIAQNGFEVPKRLIKEEVRTMLSERGGMAKDKVREELVEALWQSYAPMAEERVRAAILLNDLVERLNLEVTDADFEDWKKRMAERSGWTTEELEQKLNFAEREDHFKGVAKREKTLNDLIEKADITYTEDKK